MSGVRIILGLSNNYLCTFLRYRLPLVHLDWFRMDSLINMPDQSHKHNSFSGPILLPHEARQCATCTLSQLLLHLLPTVSGALRRLMASARIHLQSVLTASVCQNKK